MPTEFTRPATGHEADLIVGRISEAEFLRRMGCPVAPSARVTAPPRPIGEGRPHRSPVVRKLFGWNRFLDGLTSHEPRLAPLAVAIWCWLWRGERNGRVRTSERKLAERLGVCRDNVRARLGELIAAGFVIVIQRGVHGRFATVYRIRPVPKWPKPAPVNVNEAVDLADR